MTLATRFDYSTFQKLLNQGENETLDYKIECHAFEGSDKDKAELIKDIVAMSNNGYVRNWLIIGVSDDGRGFRTVSNTKLTDDNLQRLCRDNIHPVPAVRLHRFTPTGKSIDPQHAGKTFVAIQIGPQPRQCFRIVRDLIDWSEKFHFRKHEVWIRRGATSDLASPEEIKRLLEGKPATAPEVPEHNVDYSRLSTSDRRQAMLKDITAFIAGIGGAVHCDKGGWCRILLPISGRILILNLGMLLENHGKFTFTNVLEHYTKMNQHGVLFVSTEQMTKTTTSTCYVRLHESWGWLCMPYYSNIRLGSRDKEYPDYRGFCLALDKIGDTATLQRKFTAMFESLKQDTDVRRHVFAQCDMLESYLDSWSADGCAVPANDIHYIGGQPKPEKLKEDEFYDEAEKRVMKKRPELANRIREMLAIMRGQAPISTKKLVSLE